MYKRQTYTIVNEYLSGRMPLFHFDMYRLDSADDLFDIGWEDYLARGGVCAVEWSENVEEALSGAIRITIHKLSLIHIWASSTPHSRSRLPNIKKPISATARGETMPVSYTHLDVYKRKPSR